MYELAVRNVDFQVPYEDPSITFNPWPGIAFALIVSATIIVTIVVFLRRRDVPHNH